ncbi:MAG: lipoate--protein ligase family protein, partial [Ferrimicrobium sp.]
VVGAPGAPDSILLVTPSEPYVCVGYHQDAAREVDLDACRRRGLPVIRREVGGGAVYLDPDQTFVQWIMDPAHLPAAVIDRFAWFARPLVATYQSYGIDAHFRPINDIHVGNRKIGGTGAARIHHAEVLVGSFMFRFPAQEMARVLRVSSEKMRDKLVESLTDYVTSMERESTTPVSRPAVLETYIQECQGLLGRNLILGELTQHELNALEGVRQRHENPDWVLNGPGRPMPGTRIHQDLSIHEGSLKAQGGLIIATFALSHGTISQPVLHGDFSMQPSSAPLAIADAIIGIAPNSDQLLHAIEQVYQKLSIDSPGVTPSDITKAIRRGLEPLSESPAVANSQIS